MKARVLVLGAAGFIGRRVVAALDATPWATAVAAVHRSPAPPGVVASVSLDATDEAALAQAVAGMDGVVNCVAGSAATIVAAARALFSVAGRATPGPRVVHLSTMSVYGSAVGTMNESAELRGDLGAYAAAKVEAERSAAAFGRAVTLRPGCVYGADSVAWSQRTAQWLAARRVGDLGAAGDGYCNLVHVSDVVAAILAALRLPGIEGQAFNLGSPDPPTWNDYFLAFARELGTVPLRRISPRHLVLETRLWAPLLKSAELAARFTRLQRLRIPPAIPPSLLRFWGQEIRLDVRRAEDVLGVAWTPLAVGLAETAAQLRPGKC